MEKLLAELEELRGYFADEIMNNGNDNLLEDFLNVYNVLEFLYTFNHGLRPNLIGK